MHKEEKTPQDSNDYIDKKIEGVGKEEERIKAGSVEPAIAELDRLQSQWKRAFKDKSAAFRHYHELRDMYAMESIEVYEKRVRPEEEKAQRYSKVFDAVDGKYSSALRVIRIKTTQAAREYLEVNHQWKNAEGLTKEQRDVLERKWRKMDKDVEPLAKLCGNYSKFRREYVEEYEKKNNFDTGELRRHKYDWR
ncbi:MAG: hypothetical protein KAS05_00530 [Candidatus Omnitrophica bacterium]|nr:hypothetical protein [Candidatus Omnitrophota bacterium]